MSTLPQRDLRLAEEAAEWVLRRMEDRSPECSAELLKWLKLSPRHIDEFLIASTTCAALRGSEAGKRLNVEELMGEIAPNVMPLYAKGADAALSSPAPFHAGGSGRGRSTWTGSAAAVLALFVAGLWILWPALHRGETYTTGIGEQRTVRLADGSLVNMNTRSRIEVRFSTQARELRLTDGEAVFTVARDTKRPFRVVTQAAVIQALGTRFNVYNQDGQTNVSVIEGRVRVASRREGAPAAPPPALLGAGEQASVSSSGRIARQTAPDVQTAVAWQQRRLVFRAVPLAEVAEQFNRYNQYQIRIADEALGRRLIWGVFDVDEPQALAKFLARDESLTLQESRIGLTVRQHGQ